MHVPLRWSVTRATFVSEHVALYVASMLTAGQTAANLRWTF